MRSLAALALSSLLLLVGCGPAPEPAAPSTPASSASAAPSAAPAAPAASFKGATVELPATSGKGSGYLSLPPVAAGKHPAIVVIQEWWGMNDWIKQNADRLAAQGYVTLAVDLYRGKATSDPGEAHELMRGLPEDRALGDLEAGFTLLASRPDVDATKIGAVGWCMGGGYALALAAAEPKLAAAAINYGRLITDPAKIGGIKSALLGNFGGTDRGIPPADVKEFEAALKAAKKDVDIKIYDAEGHAFMNPANTKGYSAAASTDAWSRIDGFFARKLKGNAP
jgi:carboxymethylenebutenolidase